MTYRVKFDALVEPIAAREIIVNDVIDDSMFGVFPAPVTVHNGDGHVEVSVEKSTMDDLVREYESKGIGSDSLRALHIQTGIVQAALRGNLDPMEIDHLQTVHATLSSPDGLSHQVFDEAGLSEKQQTTLLLSLREGWVATDLAGINAARLAMTVAYNNTLLDGVKLPDQRVLRHEMRAHLSDTLDQQQVYTELFMSFGGDLEKATSQFANTIPRLEIMGAFPMSETEAEQLIDLIHTS